MKIFSIVTISIWLVFAGLQWNDPDPWLWIPLYMSVVVLYAGILIYPKKNEFLVWNVSISFGTFFSGNRICRDSNPKLIL